MTTPVFVNESEISHNVVEVVCFVDLNFDDLLLVIQVIDTVEFVSIPAAALKFERLTIVKNPVKLSPVFIVRDRQDAQKLRQGAASVSICVDGLFAR